MSDLANPGDPDPMSLPGHLPINAFAVYGRFGTKWSTTHTDRRWRADGHPRSFATYAGLDAMHGPCHLICSGVTIPLPRGVHR